MFNFFTALFGGLFYGSKNIYEKSKINQYDISHQQIEQQKSRLKALIGTTFEHEKIVKDYILSGNHYEEICNRHKDDFKFVFGDNWKEKLMIPPQPPVLDPKIYKAEAYSFYVPINHIYWVYRLMLANEGKVDHEILSFGYSNGGKDERTMCIRFAHCIEKRLNKTHPEIKLLLQEHPHSPGFIIDSLAASYPTYRLW